MPKKEFGEAPFPPVVRVDTSEPLTIEQVSELLSERLNGVTICVRSAEGHENRGGYFFHLKPIDETLDQCEIYNFEKIPVSILTLDKITDFINHCVGLSFDEWAYQFSHTTVNFRLDPE